MADESPELEFGKSLATALGHASEADYDHRGGVEGVIAGNAAAILHRVGVIEEFQSFYKRQKHLSVLGYGRNEIRTSLDIFQVIYTGGIPGKPILRGAIETGIKRARRFVDWCKDETFGEDLLESDPPDPAYDLARWFRHFRGHKFEIRILVITDGRRPPHYEPSPEELADLRGHPVSIEIYDLDALYKLSRSEEQQECIEVDFRQGYRGYNCAGLRAIEIPGQDLPTYLTYIPGPVLVDLYQKYGLRLLVHNVRAFLQLRRAVNSAIVNSARKFPGEFSSLNNGISAIAEGLVVEDRDHGLTVVSAANLSIVNGGQTTAALYRAATQGRDKIELDKIAVPCKITVVGKGGNDAEDSIGRKISRTANLQNKIDPSDFHSNRPFHTQLERVSRIVYGPPSPGRKGLEKWFYERVRGQYEEHLGLCNSKMQKEFKKENPKDKRFDKIELAKAIHSWDQKPHDVSYGGQKNFERFSKFVESHPGFTVDRAFFEEVIAQIILYRTTDDIVRKQKVPGYKANIVTYSVAYISFRTERRLDLRRIWKEQVVSEPIRESLETISRRVRATITDPAVVGGKNVTEFCKRPECWEIIRKMDVVLPESLQTVLLSQEAPTFTADVESTTVEQVRARGVLYWDSLAGLLAELESEDWQISLCQDVARRIDEGRQITAEQARDVNILDALAHQTGQTTGG